MSATRLGEEYDPLGRHLADPYPFYARARVTEPVFYSPLDQAWLVTRQVDVLTVLRHPELYSALSAVPRPMPVRPAAAAVLAQGYPRTPSVTESDEPLHRRLRAPFERVLSPGRVRAMEPFVRALAGRLVDTFAGAGHAELMSQYADVLPVRVIGELCALDPDDERRLRDLCQATIELNGAELDDAAQVTAATGLLELQELTGRLVRARHRGTGTDAATTIVRDTVGDDPLDRTREAMAVAALTQILLAGHITTSRAIGNAFAALLSAPGEWARLCRQPELVPVAVEELLRYAPPVTGMWRQTTAPARLGGVDLPEGARICLCFDSANRDRTVYDRAERLDVSRPARHVSFGVGIHHCVGAGLARLQLAVTLETFIARLPGLRLAGPVTIEPILNIRGPRTLEVAW